MTLGSFDKQFFMTSIEMFSVVQGYISERGTLPAVMDKDACVMRKQKKRLTIDLSWLPP
jgi:hypothetical protein